jgi:hypothetical protein
MKYVVAESNGVPPLRVIVNQEQWRVMDSLKVGWAKVFEAKTVAEAEALEALMPPAERVDKNINRS